MSITTAAVIVTRDPDATLGLTCGGCADPATHTVDVQQGTGTNVHTSVTYFLCQVHVVLELTEATLALNPTTWS